MRLNTLYNIENPKKSSKRVGRGIGSGKGKTCGAGHKGQKARTGVAIKGFEGGQMPIYRRLPKRGFNNPKKIHFKVVNLNQIVALIENEKLDIAATITKLDLLKNGLISNYFVPVKILAKGGEINKKIVIEADAFSKKAEDLIRNLGGEPKEANYENIIDL